MKPLLVVLISILINSGLQWEEWGISLGSIENEQIGIWFWCTVINEQQNKRIMMEQIITTVDSVKLWTGTYGNKKEVQSYLSQ